MSDWTTGPWKATDVYDDMADATFWEIWSQGERIAEVEWREPDAGASSARLIAVAPEMAELLSRLVALSQFARDQIHEVQHDAEGILSRINTPSERTEE